VVRVGAVPVVRHTADFIVAEFFALSRYVHHPQELEEIAVKVDDVIPLIRETG